MSSTAPPDPQAARPAMSFGLFGGAQASRGGRDPAQALREYVETCVEAEALGFTSTFLVEHHFSGSGQVSASLDVLAWVAARTTTLRVGTAVVVLPWHDPVLLAERAATLDLMSGGRLDFGVGRGYRHSEFAGFGIPYAEAHDRFEEALDVIVRAWMSDARFSHRGRFWRYDDVIVDPPPAQRPHPPIWIAAGKPESIRRVAGRGANLLLDQFASIDVIGERIALFREACEARGRRFDPLDVAVARNVFVARDASDARTALVQLAEAHAAMLELSRHPAGRDQSHITAYDAAPGATEASALYGTAEQVNDGLTALRAAGVRRVLVHAGGSTAQTIRRFSADVMPSLV